MAQIFLLLGAALVFVWTLELGIVWGCLRTAARFDRRFASFDFPLRRHE